MRWYWIDRFTEFVSGKTATAIKSIGLCEEEVDLYLPCHPVFPHSLVIEGLAQTGGILVAERSNFEGRVVLAKVSHATFHDLAIPGDTLTYTATIQTLQASGALVKGTSYKGDQLHAEIDLFFAQLEGERFDDVVLFEPDELLRMLRVWKMYDVAKNEDGSPLRIPDHMLEAERKTNSS